MSRKTRKISGSVVDGLTNRLQFRCRRLLETKEVSFLDHGRGLFRYHVLPSGLSILDPVQNVAGKNFHCCRVESYDRCDVMIFQEMRIQVPQMHLDLKVYRVDPDVSGQRMERCPAEWNWTRRWIVEAISVVGALSHRVDI